MRCKNLTYLPGSIFQLQHLESVRITKCSQFRGFEEKLMEDDIQFIASIVPYEISGSPRNSSISGLRSLEFNNCENLTHLPGSFFQLQRLESVRINECPQFRGFGEKLMNGNRQFMASIVPNREYEISGSPPRNSSISGLRSLEFLDCENLTYLPGSIFHLQHLESLRIIVCPQFRGFVEKLMEDNRLFMTSIVPNREYVFSGSPPRNSGIFGLLSLALNCCENLTHLPSSILQLEHLKSVRISKCPQFRGFGDQLIEDNRQFMASIMPNREYEILQCPPRNSSISNDDCNKEAAVQASEFLSPENFVLSDLSCFRNSTWQLILSKLDLSVSGIVSLPASIKRFIRLRSLYLENCEQLQEIPELPQNIVAVNARGCISLESFPQVSKKFQFDTSDDPLDKLIWLDLSGCRKMLKKLRNPVLNPWIRTNFRGEIPTSWFSLLEDYALDGIADYRMGLPTWFGHRNENRCRISVNLQEYLEEAITIVLCAVIIVHKSFWRDRISGSASVVCEGRSPRHVEGTTVNFGYNPMRCLKGSPYLFLAYTRVEPSELKGNHLEVEFSASSSFRRKIGIASCEVHRIDEHKKRVETQKRKRDDVLQMVVSNAEPENLLDLSTMIQHYRSSTELSGKQTVIRGRKSCKFY